MKCQPLVIDCNDQSRLPKVANGVQTVEVAQPLAVQPVLTVYFLNGVPAALDHNLTAFAISGGVRIPGSAIKIIGATTTGASTLQLTLSQPGDFSNYLLAVIGFDTYGLDPLFCCRTFNFFPQCAKFDCQPPPEPTPPLPPGPPIDYQTKDYQSFRRALLDFLPTRIPGFVETNEADLAIIIAELFAYAGDQLSYYQDAVANEAYLGTVRQRTSAKRHARLMDYHMHDGLAARAAIFFHVGSSVAPGTAIPIPQGLAVTTRETVPSRLVWFETDANLNCYREHNRIHLYTWLNQSCCLPKGATSADLVGKLSQLASGQYLLFEEVRAQVLGTSGQVLMDAVGSPVLATEAANPARRQIVRLAQIDDSLIDPVNNQPVTRVTWEEVDALTMDFCLTVDANGHPATIARANLVPASHGQTLPPETVDPDKLTLSQGPLTWLDLIPNLGPLPLYPPDLPDPKSAVASITLKVSGFAAPWNQQSSLLDSKETSMDFVVDTDNAGRGVLRFGDGNLGLALPAGAALSAVYRIGNGAAGNVGANSLINLPWVVNGVAVSALAGIDYAINPLPAAGGIDPEPIVDVQRDAPQEFAAVQYRAVTADDYAKAAGGVLGVYKAAAEFRWTGSWLAVFVAVDPVGRDELSPALKQLVEARLDSYRQAGYDLEIQAPQYVPLNIGLLICVWPDYFNAAVEEAVLDILSSGQRLDGANGFFHPNQFSFGDSLYLSRLYAAVQVVAGVRSVQAITFQRLFQPDYGETEAGELTAGFFEILRLDNNPSAPDNGILQLKMDGGK